MNKDMEGLIEKLKIGMHNHKIAEIHIDQMISYLKGFC